MKNQRNNEVVVLFVLVLMGWKVRCRHLSVVQCGVVGEGCVDSIPAAEVILLLTKNLGTLLASCPSWMYV